MIHITIQPDTFTVDKKIVNQNPYILDKKVNHKLAMEQHKFVVDHLSRNVNYVLEKTKDYIPDIVFVANGGMSLPRLPEPVIILPWMKFDQRRNELPYLKEIYTDMNIKMIEFPGNKDAPYEGAAESKWFKNGEILVMGYGHRSTKESVRIMRSLLNDIYKSYGIPPPTVISFNLQTAFFYHLDIAMLELSPTECVVNKDSIKPKDIKRLAEHDITVHVLNCEDNFCLNAIVDGDNLLIHKMKNKVTKKALEEISGKKIIECDVSEFEKSGGSVRCMVLDIFDTVPVKRKRQNSSAPSSPK